MTTSPKLSPTESDLPLWDQHARHWSHIRPPLRPAGPDLLYAQHAIDQCAADNPHLNAIVLGATPELASLCWPRTARIIAADSSLPMIQTYWPTNSPQHSAAEADWLQLPFPDHSANLVLGDGCYVLLSSQTAQPLTNSIHRILKPNGLLSIRVFTRPEIPESPDDISRQLLSNQIHNFHIFKFRLLASLCDSRGNVQVAEAWHHFNEQFPSISALASTTHWPEEEIATIRAYRNQPATYWFPTLPQFRSLISDNFEEIACHHPAYPFGDRCPTFLLRSRVN